MSGAGLASILILFSYLSIVVGWLILTKRD